MGEHWTAPSAKDLRRLEQDKGDYFKDTQEMMETFAGTKGDPALTKFIIKKLLELRTKTSKESITIRARLKRKYDDKVKHVALKKAQDKKTLLAKAAYVTEVYESKYETAQVNRQCRAYDRIMGLLNSMADWKVCKSGWTKIGFSCYKVAPRGYAYLAEGKCLKIGGSLIRIDTDDDKKALKQMSASYVKGKTDSHLIVGFFRSLRTGKWEYLDGTDVNPITVTGTTWAAGNYNSRYYNYAGYYGGNKRVYAAVWNWGWGALCEHRLNTWMTATPSPKK